MPVIFDNHLDGPNRESVEDAIVAAIGDRSRGWLVRIFPGPGKPGWTVSLHGPEGFVWEETFAGAEQQTPEAIAEAVRAATDHLREAS